MILSDSFSDYYLHINILKYVSQQFTWLYLLIQSQTKELNTYTVRLINMARMFLNI